MKNLLFTIIQRLIINAMYMFIHSEEDSEHTIMRIKTSAPKHQQYKLKRLYTQIYLSSRSS